MKRCIVLRHREDPWYLDTQREAIQRLYGVDTLVAGYPDTRDTHVDIPLEYTEGLLGNWPSILFESARKVIQMYPKGTLLLEGDMIPHVAIELVPTIRRYHTQLWPGIIYTGDAEVDTGIPWTFAAVAEVFKDFFPLDYVRNEQRFDTIGPRAEFLHPQGGCRSWKHGEKLERFKVFHAQHTQS
jgi:hypothetical protein